MTTDIQAEGREAKWAEEFDKMYVDVKEVDGCGAGCCPIELRTLNPETPPKVIKTFIRRVRQEAQREVSERAVGAVVDCHALCGVNRPTCSQDTLTALRALEEEMKGKV